MKYFALNLETLSPLAIRADHSPTGSETIRYISGTALMGSLASTYRLFASEKTEEFEQLFLREQALYPNLYPAAFKNKNMQGDADTRPIYPLPATAQSCKRFPGFLSRSGNTSDDEERHGVRDSLLDWALFSLADRIPNTPPSILLAPFQDHKKCGRCKKDHEYPINNFTGYYRRDSDGQMVSARTDMTRLQTHTGINRTTGTVQEGILYNRRVFDEHMRFWGMVKLPDDLATPFAQFIKQVGRSGLVRIGTGRTRGMGKVSISATPLPNEQVNFEAFQKRLSTFDHKLRDEVREFNKEQNLNLKNHPFYFALTLHSPAILRDNLLRYRGSIDEETLAELTGLSSLDRIYQSASVRRTSGWNDLWGTPRTNDVAIDTGSVFLFASTQPREELQQILFKLETEGIGTRRAEGFGRICVSDPFHLEVTV